MEIRQAPQEQTAPTVLDKYLADKREAYDRYRDESYYKSTVTDVA